MDRLASVQAMRGIAATLVVMAHAHPFGLTAPIGQVAGLGGAGVDLFFIISGFVMALSTERLHGPRDAAHFLLLRVIRIAPLFWLISIPAAALALQGEVYGPALAALNTLTFVPLHTGPYVFPFLNPGWTLGFEFLFYGMVAVLVCSSSPRRLPTLAAALLALPLLPFQDHPWALARWLCSPILAEFAFGIIAFLLWRAGQVARFRPAVTALALASAAALVVLNGDFPFLVLHPSGLFYHQLGAYRVFLIGLPCFALFLWLLPRAAPRFLRAIGDFSYSLYLVHTLVMVGAELILPRSMNPELAFVLRIGAALAAGWATYHWIEEPMTARLRAWVKRPAPALA